MWQWCLTVPYIEISRNRKHIYLHLPFLFKVCHISFFAFMYSSGVRKKHLKGQCHEIFCFWFFSWISFPPAPEYSIKTVSNFFKNSRRYSQLHVCHQCRWHRWQMEKIFNQKNFNHFVWSPLGSRGNICIYKFLPSSSLHVSATWYCSHYLPLVLMTPVANLPPVSLIPVAICHRCRCHRW